MRNILPFPEIGGATGLAAVLVEAEHPTFGEHERLATSVTYSRSETIAEPGVLNGQHTNRILTELGYDEAAIEDPTERKIACFS